MFGGQLLRELSMLCRRADGGPGRGSEAVDYEGQKLLHEFCLNGLLKG